MKTLFKARVNKDLLKYLLNQHKTLIAVFTVLFFAVFPLSVITEILSPINSTIMVNVKPELVPSLLIVFAVPVFLVSPLILFNYSFSKKAVSTFHSMPIKRRDLFSTLALVSFICAIVPFAINYGLGYGIAYIWTNVNFDINHIFNLIRVLVLLCSLTAITILVISNTGALSEAIIYTGIALIIPYVGMLAFGFFMERFILGYSDVSEMFLYYLSPIMSMFKVFSQNTYTNFNFQLDLVISYWFLALLIMNVISINLFNVRKSERAEQPFTNNLFFPIVASCFTVFLLIALVSMFAPYDGSIFEISTFIMPVMISFIIFIILNIIKNRSTKGLLFAVKNFVVIVVVTIIISVTIVMSGALGYVNRVPDISKVESIQLENNYNSSLNFPTYGNSYQIKDKSSIKLFIDMHSKIINDNKNKYEIDSSVYQTLTFTYNLSNGSSMKRNYKIGDTALNKFFTDLSGSVEVKAPIEQLRDSKFIKDFMITSPFMDISYEFNGDFKEMLDIYTKELKDITLGDFNSSGGVLKYNILISTSNNYIINSLHIDDRFTQTIEYIESYMTGNKISNLADIDVQRVTQSDEDACLYSPFKGVISSESSYYSCSNMGLSHHEVDYNEFEIHPYIYGKESDAVLQVNYYGSDFGISLLMPAIKK